MARQCDYVTANGHDGYLCCAEKFGHQGAHHTVYDYPFDSHDKEWWRMEREDYDEGRAAGIAEAANLVNADLSLFDEGMPGIATVADFVHVFKRRIAAKLVELARDSSSSHPKEPK